MRQPSLPKFSYNLFKWFCHEDFLEELQGDLEENFLLNSEEKGKRKARKIYRYEIIKLLRPSAMRKFNILPKAAGQLSKNYLKTSLRAIKLNPFYVFANVAGLALALSICTIGYFNYRYNATFNTHFEQAENLYKIHGLRTSKNPIGNSSIPLASVLKANGIPAMRYTNERVAVKLDKKLFNENTAFADPDFFKYFQMENLAGEVVKAPQNSEIIISKATALKLFDEPYPIGKFVHLVFPNQEERSFSVIDVFADLPTNVSFYHSIILSMDNYLDAYAVAGNEWSNWVDASFVYLEKNEVQRLTALLKTYVEVQNTANPELEIASFSIDNILDWPALESSFQQIRFRLHLHPSSVVGIGGSALAILLLACFNFINTSIALSGKRLKEIAIRKILGGNRKSTITQFMLENALMISIAVILSFGISALLIPSYNTMFQQELIQLAHVPFQTIITFSLVLIFIVTLLSGAYPALHVSKFPPLVIFREKVILTGKNTLMSLLLTFQFALCFYNMFGLFLLVDNAKYQETLDRGYGVNQVINIPISRSDQFAELKDHISQNPNVVSVAGSESLVGFSNEDQYVHFEGVDHPVALLTVGVGYSETLGLRLGKGSFFSSKAGHKNEVIINQMLQDQIGVDLLNKAINVGDEKFTVIGIVDDFNQRSIMMDNRIKPAVIRIAESENFRYASIQISGLPEDVNKEVEAAWYELFPRELYTGFLQKDVMRNMHETNKIMIIINVFLGTISILISVLGLYTLISLTVQRRSKEFGVRKVLGAPQSVIIGLLGRNLYWILGISSVLGLTGAYYVLGIVFDIIYAYHISANFMHFGKAVVSVLAIVVIAIGYKVVQTGRMNPVKQLRTE